MYQNGYPAVPQKGSERSLHARTFEYLRQPTMSSDGEDEYRRKDETEAKKKKKRKKDKKKRKEKKKKRSRSGSSAGVDDDVHLKRKEELGVDDSDAVKPAAAAGGEKEKKKRSRSDSAVSQSSVASLPKRKKIIDDTKPPAPLDAAEYDNSAGCRPIVESSNLDYTPGKEGMQVTLLLFYQYQEPPWSEKEYKFALQHAQYLGEQAGITGRMRVAKEGFNCTLTGSRDAILTFCHSLRAWKADLFRPTEFKLTNHLPTAQAFKDLKIIPVQELVHYGLEGSKAPPITDYHGQHLEPADYHKKMTEDDTVMIDVRNHYEAQIGRFDPPAAEWVDPNMRKSTEFPVWLDDPQTREKLRGKVSLVVVPCWSARRKFAVHVKEVHCSKERTLLTSLS